jgi:hypothetical protein
MNMSIATEETDQTVIAAPLEEQWAAIDDTLSQLALKAAASPASQALRLAGLMAFDLKQQILDMNAALASEGDLAQEPRHAPRQAHQVHQ